VANRYLLIVKKCRNDSDYNCRVIKKKRVKGLMLA